MANNKLQAPRGTRDILADESRLFRWIEQVSWQTVTEFGFEEIQTPMFEFAQVFQKTLGEASDIVTKEMYTFEDKGGELITLRPEGTAGVARAFISEQMGRQLPLKFYYKGAMFRYERPQKGRYRQFHQLGVELLGVDSTQADIEAVSMAYLLLQRLGIMQNCVLEINSIGDTDSRKTYREELVGFLNKHREKLSKDSQNRIERNPLRVLDSKEDSDQKVLLGAPRLPDYLNQESLDRYNELKAALDTLGIAYKENPFLVRGLDYYNHSVFEFTTDQLGSQAAVLSGGRYDELISTMGGPKTAGVGWAAGLERLALLVKQPPQATSRSKLAVIAADDESLSRTYKLAFELRSHGFPTEQPYTGNLSKKMKKAGKSGAHWAIVLGGEELARGKVNVKDFHSGEQHEVELTQLIDFLEAAPTPPPG